MPKSNNSSREPSPGKLLHPFDPIIDENSRILVLGTFPSIKSFEKSFYYAHPQNQFWKILSEILHDKVPDTIEEKIEFLQRHGIALWDMVKGCKRENSLDSSLKDIEVNDIEAFLKKYPNIQALFFTGRKSQELFERNFSHLDIPRYYLLSPSPAFRKATFEEKVRQWSILKDFLR